jgi:hypothetical protein
VAPSDVPPSRASLDEEWRFVLKGVWRSWRSIFFHNLVAVLLIVTTGVISHRVSAGLVMMNGYALGSVGTAFVGASKERPADRRESYRFCRTYEAHVLDAEPGAARPVLLARLLASGERGGLATV